MIIVWILAVIGLLAIGCLYAFLLDYRHEPPMPHTLKPVPKNPAEARLQGAVSTKPLHDNTTESWTEEELVGEYRGLIDDLYNYGEGVAKRRRELP